MMIMILPALGAILAGWLIVMGLVILFGIVAKLLGYGSKKKKRKAYKR